MPCLLPQRSSTPMIHLQKKEKIFKNAIKQIISDPFVVCGTDGCVGMAETRESFKLDGAANALAASADNICVGLYDGKVMCKKKDGSFECIYSHTSNVCSIDCSEHFVLSGSWDHNAILHCLNGPRKDNFVMSNFRHPESVWCTQIVSETRFVTGCADGKIRIFDNFSLSKEIAYHEAPVRGLLYEDHAIYSVDNHGKVHKNGIDGRLLKARMTNEFMYCICRYDEFIITGGENGAIFIFNNDLEIVDKVEIKCSSVWSLRQMGAELYAAGSDGCLYKFSKGPGSAGSVDDIEVSEYKENSNKIEKQGGPNNDGGSKMREYKDCDTDITNADMISTGADSASTNNSETAERSTPDKDANGKSGDKEFVSGGLRYKVEGSKVYVNRGSGWELIGDSIDKKWDHTIPVTLGDKEYSLSFNDSDNVHEVASKFIRKNKLDPQFHDDIVNHIQKNFKAASLYKKHENIDLAGVEKIVGNHKIIEVLGKVKKGEYFSALKKDSVNIYQIEEILFNEEEGQKLPLFVVLDACKYLVGRNLPIDLSFIFRRKFLNAKEAKALVLLLTNIVDNPPFKMEALDKEIRYLLDDGILTKKDLHYYDTNKEIKRKQ